jgi:hypothetical protein
MKTRLKIASLLAISTLLLAAAPAAAMGGWEPSAEVALAPDGMSFAFNGYWVYGVDYYVEYCDGTWDLQQVRPQYHFAIEFDKPARYVDVMAFYWWGGFYGYPSDERECGGGRAIVIDKMLLYTSETGFDVDGDGVAEYNTCSIISGSSASTERIEILCGDVPDDLNLPCGGAVYDDGTDDGYWVCDPLLRGVWEENRLPVFGNDGNNLKAVDKIHKEHGQGIW